MRFEDLKGQTLKKCEWTRCPQEEGNDAVLFELSDGRRYFLVHKQACCEHVNLEDVCGRLEDLVGSPITMAEESTSDTVTNEYDGIQQFTFYRLATVKGYVTLRFNGESNGCYSVGVDFVEETK